MGAGGRFLISHGRCWFDFGCSSWFVFLSSWFVFLFSWFIFLFILMTLGELLCAIVCVLFLWFSCPSCFWYLDGFGFDGCCDVSSLLAQLVLLSADV